MLKRIFKKIKTSSTFRFVVKNIFYGVARVLIATYRLKVIYGPGVKQPILANDGVFYFWHQQIIAGMTFFFKTHSTGYCVASPSGDGQMAGYVCQRLGFTVLYGSSHKSSIQVVRQALAAIKETGQLCIVGDGSRGPAFKLQDGITYLASKTQVPTIYVECSSSWYITLSKSWDKFQIPLPFSKINVHVHTPEQV